MIHIKKNKLYYIIAIGILASVFLSYLWVYAINTIDEGWRVNAYSVLWVWYSTENQWIPDCRKIVNNWDKAIFIPTKTREERDSFFNQKPTTIDIQPWIWVCGQNEDTCDVGTLGSAWCDYWERRRTCIEVCDGIFQNTTSCWVASQSCEQP